jgi:hypothetical protein
MVSRTLIITMSTAMSAAIAEYTSINIFIVSGVFHCMRTAIARKIAGMRESTANIVGYITIEISA